MKTQWERDLELASQVTFSGLINSLAFILEAEYVEPEEVIENKQALLDLIDAIKMSIQSSAEVMK